MLIAQAKLKGIKELRTGRKLTFFIANRDLDSLELIKFMQEQGTAGYLTFSPDKLKAAVEEVMKNKKIGIDEKGKSRSELMRGALYEFWLEGYPGGKPFEDFYSERMDSMITKIKHETGQIQIDNMDDYYHQVKNKFDSTLNNLANKQKEEE